MTTRWWGVALVGGWLATAAVAFGQGPGEPVPVGPACGPMGGNPIQGPLTTPYAPHGPEDDLGLPPNLPNAYTPKGCYTECCPVAYISGEWLYWRVKDADLPGPIVTGGGTGIVGAPGTQILVGTEGLDYQYQSGGRVTQGFWFDPSHTVAFEGSGFILERKPLQAFFASDATGTPLLAVPFVNAATGAESVFPLISNPANGTVGAISFTQSMQLWGAEANLVVNAPGCCICGCNVGSSLFAGFRYLDFSETTALNTFRTAAGGVAPLTLTQDQFRTRNQFYGGQVGCRLGITSGAFFVAGQAKIAYGSNDAHSDTSGSTTTVPAAGLPNAVPGGLLAVASNSGRFGIERTTFVPEGEGRLGFQFGPHVTLWGGYTFLYWDSALRANSQIDRQIGVDPNGLTRPAVLLDRSSMWVQGVNVGLEIIY